MSGNANISTHFCGSILQHGYVYDTINREIKQIKGVKLL